MSSFFYTPLTAARTMKEHEHYQQAALALGAPQEAIALPRPGHERATADKPVPSIAVTGAGAPIPGDFMREYAFELATRERLGLPELSPSEFRAIRNWRDGIEEDRE